MSKEYFLIDTTEGRDAIRRDRIYNLIARLCLWHGFPGDNFYNFTDKQIFKHWEYGDPYPTRGSLNHCEMRLGNIKWYIKNKIECEDEIWNGDFINGLMLHGIIRRSKVRFPSFIWYHNKFIHRILKSSPFGGNISIYKRDTKTTHYEKYTWKSVPAISLSHDKDSISYLAGFLAGGQPYSRGGVSYARYNHKFEEYIDNLGIPIEGKVKGRNWVLISPIWPAIFTIRMPECIREIWTDIKKPVKSGFYAPILWKTYVNNDFVKNGIPYLQARRTVFYKFKCEEGAMKALDKFRVDKNLVALDYRIRDVVKCWHKEK